MNKCKSPVQSLFRNNPVRGAAIVSASLLNSCSSGPLDPHGPIGAAERIILFNATVIMLAVVVPVIVLTLVFRLVVSRRQPKARRLPDWAYSGRLELVVWSIPALVVLFLGGIAWIGSHDLDPPTPIRSEAQPVEIEVVSLDWKWLFIYPGEGDRQRQPAGRAGRARRFTSG